MQIARSLADATAALTGSEDLAGILVGVLDDCLSVLRVQAAGVMVRVPTGSVEVLCASSHQADELELYQSQVGSGPCLDSIDTGLRVMAVAGDAAMNRWPEFSTAFLAAGFRAVHAEPMRWQGTPIGGLNLFRSAPDPLDPEEVRLAEAFADILTIATVHAGHLPAEEAVRRAALGLASRNVIEQAKGALAYLENLDMATAYRELKRRSAEDGLSLTQTATEVLARARQRL